MQLWKTINEAAMVGSASVGTRILGSDERQRDGWNMEGIHQAPNAAGAGWWFHGCV